MQFGRGPDGIEQKGSHGELTHLTGIRRWTGSFTGAGDCITLFALLTPLGVVHLLESRPLAEVPRIRARVDDMLDRRLTRQLESDIARADIVLSTMLFMDEHVRAILPSLLARRPHCDAMIGCLSASEVVKTTRLNRFDMDSTKRGALDFLKKLRGKPGGQGNGARTFALDLRLVLAREHLDLAHDGSEDDEVLDPDRFIRILDERADALDAWHEGGRQGPRPPGRLRSHRAEQLPRYTRLWATPVYRMLVDPDGRPIKLRLKKSF